MQNNNLKFIEVSRNNGVGYRVPYWELDSGRPGPAVLVIGAMHGNEIQSPEIIRRFREIAMGKLIAGSCILIPFCNPVAVHGRHAHIDFEVGRYYGRDQINNLNCSWPGDPNGSDTQRLSYALFNTVVQKATHCIDLHCWQSMTATTVLPQHDNPGSMGMATATRLPFMKYNTDRKTKPRPEYPCILTEYFNDSGRPALDEYNPSNGWCVACLEGLPRVQAKGSDERYHEKIGILAPTTTRPLIAETKEIASMLQGLINSKKP